MEEEKQEIEQPLPKKRGRKPGTPKTGGRKKGLPRTGGRKAGVPNKITAEKRELIAKFIDGKWDDFNLAYDAIDDPYKKCSIMLGLMPFAFPKLATIEYKDKTPPKTLADELDEISGLKTQK